MSEVDLYEPVKAFLERQGYTVKGEIGHCDVVAVRAGEPPVVVELKSRLTLVLLLQAVDRLGASDHVYIAFGIGARARGTWRTHRKQVVQLLRRVGLGLLTVSEDGHVRAELDPLPYTPRVRSQRRARLLREFVERVGDPEQGGSPARARLTAYRQDALRCARALVGEDALKASVVRDRIGVDRAARILQQNHYGWFERVRTGYYRVSPRGIRELEHWGDPERDATP